MQVLSYFTLVSSAVIFGIFGIFGDFFLGGGGGGRAALCDIPKKTTATELCHVQNSNIHYFGHES